MIVATGLFASMGVAVAVAMTVAWGHSMRRVIFLSREQGKEMPAFFPKQGEPNGGNREKA